ncbi:MAG: VCBS repeat-containing protein, partial [Acidobacteria bacterium]|nr:VCBS repeat-containing protein [Acidobacteriota bacterium]
GEPRWQRDWGRDRSRPADQNGVKPVSTQILHQSLFNEVDALKTPQRYRNPRLLYWNLGGGKFEQIATVPGVHSSRGAAAGDFDNDGDLDILVMNRNEPPSLLRNDNRSGNRWVMVNAPTGSTICLKAAGASLSMSR